MDLRRGGKAAIDRIIEAYGFTTKQALCDKLGISSSTLANRYTRDSLPTDFIVQCAIETGTSVEWLAFGTENNQQASPPSQAITEPHQRNAADSIRSTAKKSPNEIKIDPNKGGKAAIERLVEAYGFTTRQALANHLGVSKSTLANRYLRDTFPADWIIQCALETGISLDWLATGQGLKRSSQTVVTEELVKFTLSAGKMIADGSYFFDATFLPANLASPIVVVDGETTYICEKEYAVVLDGQWLISIDGSYSVRLITRLPKGMVKVSTYENNFECNFSDIQFIAKIDLIISNVYKRN